MRGRFRWAPSTTTFVALIASLNAALYHLPLFSFAWGSVDLSTATGVATLATVVIALFLGTALLLLGLALVSHRILKPICMVLAIGNAVALYFLTSYHVVLDDTMMGNVLNTNFAEASEFLHPALVVEVLVMGVLPCWLLTRVSIRPTSRLRLVILGAAGTGFLALWAYLAGATWPWIDHNSKRLGGLILPWSYVINLGRHVAPEILGSNEQILLPPATFDSNEKTVVILVIGEAAREQNFSLYGYERPTNPLLSKAGVVVLKSPTSCATYTTASVRCMLSNADTQSPFAKRYEPLPSYLQRNGVDVIWRTHNFGEPPLKVQNYERASELSANCSGPHCQYDEVLLTGLAQRIESSSSQRVFVVLHQSGSHGPAYYTRYPDDFEVFKPACRSVELSKCTPQALVNTYDDTILYTDFFLSRTIGVLKGLPNTRSLLIYLSDHGESLGERGLYLHGLPSSIAPDTQKDIPFIVWMSDQFARGKGVDARTLASQAAHTQRDVFHSVMGAFSMRSPIYEARYDIFSPSFGSP